MKKPLLLLIALIFLTVSCSSSKKAENDTDNDILPDEDAADEDAADEDGTDDNDEIVNINPCEQNPCENFANVDGT